MIDYTYFYKQKFSIVENLSELGHYDLFISSFLDIERVKEPSLNFERNEELWFVLERDSSNLFLQNKRLVILEMNNDYQKIMDAIKSIELAGKRICVDATGFSIHYLLFLIRVLYYLGVKKFDVIYTEPQKYKNDEETEFSDKFDYVTQITGMSGSHTSETENDLLIIAAGYDHGRIVDVANSKKHATKALLFGFPSISPGMFQENILRAFKAEPAVGSDCFNDMGRIIYAPAYDPFVAAQAIQDYIEHCRKLLKKEKGASVDFTNIYLAPLSTKPHALGMALYFMWERGWRNNITLLYPLCHEYHADNSVGIARIWNYRFELPEYV